jgi:hypothetical protein
VKTTFKDVAGLKGPKEEIHEKTQRNTQTSVVLKGALLVGPGTGRLY